MLISLFFAALFAGIAPDELSKAIDNYRQIESYVVTIHSASKNNIQNIKYYYKRPGFVRMDFINPHDGAVLIYSPTTHRVNLWPFGIGHFPKFNLNPTNSLIRGDSGQRIDHSDIGTLFENIRALAIEGTTENNVLSLGQVHLIITGVNNQTSKEGIHRYELWLDTKNEFPSKVISYDLQNRVVETVVMENPTINIQLPEGLFNP